MNHLFTNINKMLCNPSLLIENLHPFSPLYESLKYDQSIWSELIQNEFSTNSSIKGCKKTLAFSIIFSLTGILLVAENYCSKHTHQSLNMSCLWVIVYKSLIYILLLCFLPSQLIEVVHKCVDPTQWPVLQQPVLQQRVPCLQRNRVFQSAAKVQTWY